MRMFGLGFTSNVILDMSDVINEGIWRDSDGIEALVFLQLFCAQKNKGPCLCPMFCVEYKDLTLMNGLG